MSDVIFWCIFAWVFLGIIPFFVAVDTVVDNEAPSWVIGAIFFWPIFLPFFLVGVFLHSFISIFKYGFKTIGR